MRLIPPTIDPDTPSPGERLVFGRLVALAAGEPSSGPDTTGWTVLHSLDVVDPAARLAGEVDFLVVVPGKGVLVLEVKGAQSVRRRDGLWYYGTGAEPDGRGPFKQASEAMHAVRAHVVKQHPDLARLVFWSAVCFPYVDFHVVSEEWFPWQVIDRRALEARGLTASLEAVLDRARERLVARGAPWFHPQRAEPRPEQCLALIAALRRDFELNESPRAHARRVGEQIRHYTEEQFEALDAIAANPRVVFDGPAGTGKTLLAVETARRAVSAGKRVLFLCFSRPLGRWLQEETAELVPSAAGRAGVRTSTLHEHMRALVGITPTPAQVCSQSFWQNELPEAAQLALLERIERAAADGGRSRYVYDEIVLDEAQDVLRSTYMDFLDLSVRGGLRRGTWRFFGDFDYQRVYDAGALTLDDVLGTGVEAVRYALRVNCRNTPRVAALAERCGDLHPGYRRVRRPDDELAPQIVFWSDPAQQLRLLAEVLETLTHEGFAGAATAVLSPLGDRDCAAAGLSQRPWRDRLEPLVREARELGDSLPAEAGGDDEGDWPAACIPSDLDAVELHSGKTPYCSILRFKGLESPAVVVSDVTDVDDPVSRSLLYVACTRALQRLVILAHESLRGSL